MSQNAQHTDLIRRLFAKSETLSAEDMSMILWRDYRLDVSVEVIRKALI